MNLASLHRLAASSAYNEENKSKFKKEAIAQFKEFAKKLNLPEGSYEVRFNAGGVAVSGDATLHHEKFYLNLNEYGCYWRTVKGLKDYTGGPNQWLINPTGADNSQDFRKQIIRLIS